MSVQPLLRDLELPAGRFATHTHHFSLVYSYMLFISRFNIVEGREDPEKYRFQVELEFVQCLANPNYLNCELTCSLAIVLNTDMEYGTLQPTGKACAVHI